MNNKASVKHHFLPRHYLKGFTNDAGKFFVYDKKTNKIFESSPSNTFFEKHLNTITFSQGDTSDFLENLYSHTESVSLSSIDQIRSSNKDSKIDLLDKMNLYLFLLFLHWRLPTNTDAVRKLSKLAFNESEVLNFVSLINNDGTKAPENIIKKISSFPGFEKALRVIIPFTPFYKDNHWQEDVLRWRFLYPAQGDNWFVIGDVPLITKVIYDHDPVECLKEFIFPISGKILLVNINPPIQTGFSPELIMEFNLCVFIKSKRFVASPNEMWLRSLVKYFTLHEKFKKTEDVIPKFFESLTTGSF